MLAESSLPIDLDDALAIGDKDILSRFMMAELDRKFPRICMLDNVGGCCECDESFALIESKQESSSNTFWCFNTDNIRNYLFVE